MSVVSTWSFGRAGRKNYAMNSCVWSVLEHVWYNVCQEHAALVGHERSARHLVVRVQPSNREAASLLCQTYSSALGPAFSTKTHKSWTSLWLYNIYIYIYAVKLKTGPRFGGFKFKSWSKLKVKNWSKFFHCFPIFIVFWGYVYKHK